MRRRNSFILTLLATAACGGGGGDPVVPPPPPPPPPAVAVAVNPPTASINAGATQDFSATVTNSTNTAVTWSANAGTVAGTGNTITYTAPAVGGSYTVTATSVADNTKSAGAAVTVAPVTVQVAPNAPSLMLGEPVTLTATVTGAAPSGQGVTWNASCGSITGTGASVTYTSPTTAGTCSVTATSVLDPTKTGTSAITVKPVFRVAALDDANDGACTWTHCSMREAIAAANAGPGADTIRFSVPAASALKGIRAPGGVANVVTTITLTSALPAITTNTHIIGPGVDLLTIHAGASIANQRRIFEFNGAFPASVSGMTLTGGVAAGGGAVYIQTNADVSLTDVTIFDNEARDGSGGGLLVTSNGTARLLRVNLDNNEVFGTNQPGGAISLASGGAVLMTQGRIKDNIVNNGWGGGIQSNNGGIQLINVSVEGNRTIAGTGGGGGILAEGTGAVVLNGTTITGNATPLGEGGGLRLLASVTGAFTNVNITNNTANSGGGLVAGNTGALTLTGGNITGNTGATRAGGVFLWGTSDVTFINVTIATNTATLGGGGGMYLMNTAVARLAASNITGNRALGTLDQHGGGVRMSTGTKFLMTDGSIATNETAAGWGAGLYSSGAGAIVTLVRALVRANTGLSNAGGGLAILDGTVLTMTGGSVKENRAGGGSGGGIHVDNGTATVTNAEVSDNIADFQGGGVQIRFASTVTLTNVTVGGNRANEAGGGLGVFTTGTFTMTGSIVENNIATTSSGGGLVRTGTPTILITDSRFTSNTTGSQGGGLQLAGTGGTTTLRRVIVNANTAALLGGGVTNGGTLLLENSTINGNTSNGTAGNSSTGFGGGVWAAGGVTTIRNSTFANNNAINSGGGVGASGQAVLLNNTFANNNSGIFGAGISSIFAGNLSMSNTLLSANTSNSLARNCGSSDGGVLTSTGNNLSDDAACTFLTQISDKNNVAAGLGALTINGGTTTTFPLLAGSAAINSGNNTTCPTTDQRGFSRVGICDIGSFEFGGTAPAPAPIALLGATPWAPRSPALRSAPPVIRSVVVPGGPGVGRVGTAASAELVIRM